MYFLRYNSNLQSNFQLTLFSLNFSSLDQFFWDAFGPGAIKVSFYLNLVSLKCQSAFCNTAINIFLKFVLGLIHSQVCESTGIIDFFKIIYTFPKVTLILFMRNAPYSKCPQPDSLTLSISMTTEHQVK